MIKLIFFDLYYTLIDISNVNKEKLDFESWKVLVDNGYKIKYDDFIKLSNNVYSKWRNYREANNLDVNSRVWWQEVLLRLKIPAKVELLDELLCRRYSKYREMINLYDDVIETLKFLKENNIMLGLITNSSDGGLVRGDLKHLGIIDFFSLMYVSS
ncbi:MAG: HAD family hydrolase, partial [Candidatus Odinarchaeia archaeon]